MRNFDNFILLDIQYELEAGQKKLHLCSLINYKYENIPGKRKSHEVTRHVKNILFTLNYFVFCYLRYDLAIPITVFAT